MDLEAQAPGPLIAASYEVPPGNNEVQAYLDVVGDGDLLHADVELLLSMKLGEHVPHGPSAVLWRHQGVAARYFLHLAQAANPRTVFQRMANTLLALVKNPTMPPPFKVERLRFKDSTVYRLTDDSKDRLHRLSHDWNEGNISVEDSVAADLKSAHGSEIEVQFAVALTGLAYEDLSAMGGVEFWQAGMVVSRWPGDPVP
ncbi:MAG: hypothetical protein QM723_18445 [Myxococcaceae bacterium]